MFEKKSNSFVEDLKLISNILKCKIQEVSKNKDKIMQLERLEEIYSKSSEDFEMIKFCLDDIIDADKKAFLQFSGNVTQFKPTATMIM